MQRKSIIVGFVFLLVFALSSPAFAQQYKPHLNQIGFTNMGALPGGNTEVAIQNDVAYVGSLGGGSGVKIVDVTNPSQLDFLYNIPIENESTMDLKVQADSDSDLQNVLAVSTQGASDKAGFFLYDISKPRNPVQKSFTKLAGGVHNLFVYGDYLYVTRSGKGMAIYNISDLSHPQKVAMFAVNQSDVKYGGAVFVHDIFVQENNGRTYAYLAYWDAGARIVDVTNPATPVQVGKYEYPKGNAHYVEPTPNGNYLLVGDEVPCGEPGGIHVLDIRNLGDIQQVGFWEPPETGAQQCSASENANSNSKAYHSNAHAYAWTGHNFSVENDIVYQGGYKTGVHVIDISEKTNPETVAKYRNTAPIGEEKKKKNTSSYDERPFYWSAIPYEGHIYAVDIDAGLLVLDLQKK